MILAVETETSINVNKRYLTLLHIQPIQTIQNMIEHPTTAI